MKRSILIITTLLVVGTLLAPTVVLAADDPRFETQVPEPTVTPGQTTQIAVEFTNDAEDIDDDVETATDVEVTMQEGDTPFTVLSGTHRLGTMPDGQVLTDQFSVRVPQNIDPGTYHIPIRVDYVFEGDEEESTTVYAEVVVEDRPQFSLETASDDLRVGEDGSVSVTIENNGTETASAASVTLQSATENVVFGSSANTVSYVGEWDAGESKSITVNASSPPSADPGEYTVTASVGYENSEGFERQSGPLDTGVTVDPEQDQFSLTDIEDSLRVGQQGDLSMTVTNEDEAVTEAVVQLEAEGPNIQPLTTEYAIGAMDSGEATEVTFPIEILEAAEASPRQFSFAISYTNENGDKRVADGLNVQATIDPEEDHFALESVEDSLQVGEQGDISMTVTNEDEVVTDAVVRLTANGPNIKPLTTEYAIGEMDAGGASEVSFPIEISESAEATPRQFSFAVAYEDSDGDDRVTEGLNVQATIEPEQDQFALESVEHSLRVGEEGDLTMTVINDEEAATDAVVHLTNSGTNIHPLASEYAIGSMGAGESKEVSFPIEISESAEATPRQFSFAVAYEDSDGDERRADGLNVQVSIEPDRDRFAVSTGNASVEAGGSNTISLSVTNQGNKTVSEVNAKIFTNDPLSSGDDEAYIDSLAPGESTKITFGVAAAGSANVKTYPISLDFQYDSDGDSKLSKTYQIPVSVTESESSGPSPYLIVGVIALVLIVIAAVIYRRR